MEEADVRERNDDEGGEERKFQRTQGGLMTPTEAYSELIRLSTNKKATWYWDKFSVVKIEDATSGWPWVAALQCKECEQFLSLLPSTRSSRT
jgi:hypothetical protein